MSGERHGLVVQGVTKSFGPNRVLDGIDLEVPLGEVHGLLGLNGSGKSTLVKLLSGYHKADSGHAVFDGDELGAGSAAAHRVVVLHQDLGLEESLPVLDNIVVGARYGTPLLRSVRRRALTQRVRELLEELRATLDPDRVVASLTASEKAQVAFARAMFSLKLTGGSEPLLFVLDEPTANLPTDEVQVLIDTVRRVAAAGNAVIYVSHRMAEIEDVTRRFSILRDGRVTLSADTADVTREDMIEAMLGAPLEAVRLKSGVATQRGPGVEARSLSGSTLRNVDLHAPRGVVTGVTGLAGMGHEELPELLLGLRKASSGEVRIEQAPLPTRGAYRFALRRGMALVPADRLQGGLWREGSAGENVSLTVLRRFSGILGLKRSREIAHVRDVMTKVGVVPIEFDMPVSAFSGGNQQKLLLGKWLQTEPSIWILHEPIQGVDAAATQSILQHMRALAETGACVLLVTADFSQLVRVCDRVYVVRDGLVVGTLAGEEVTEREVTRLAQGAVLERVVHVEGGLL